jgi:hypothetical protein
MVSTMKPTIALAFAVAVGAAAATPASAQVITQQGTPGVAHEAFPFAYVNAPGPNGQCWVMSDRTMGYGYWGKCPEAVAAAPAPSRRTQRQARSARAATTAPPAAGTAAVVATAPAAPTIATTAPAAPTIAIGSPESARATAGPVVTEAFPFAYVSSPAPDGQCWVLSDRTMGYGYWGKCP